MDDESPAFPITIKWPDEEIPEVFEVMEDLATQLEWLDSEDARGGAVVLTDKNGRRVRLKLENTRILEFRPL